MGQSDQAERTLPRNAALNCIADALLISALLRILTVAGRHARQ